MARIKLGAIISDLSGSIAGTTFQKNAFGITARAKPKNSYAGTLNQSAVQRAMAQSQFFWHNMSDEQRLAFDRFSSFRPQYAKHNKNSLLGGYQLFMKYSLLALLAGDLPQFTIKFVSPSISPTSCVLRRYGAQFSFDIGVNIQDTQTIILAKFSRPYNNNNFIPPTGLRACRVNYSNIAGAENFVDYSYVEKFGALPSVGQFLLCEFTVMSFQAPIIYPILSGIVQVTS